MWLSDGRNAPQRVRLQRCWLATSRGGQAIFHFEGIDTIEAAERLRGLEVQVPIEQRAKLDAGNYYVGDLVGCEVWEPGAPVSDGFGPRCRISGRRSPVGCNDRRRGSTRSARRGILYAHRHKIKTH